MTTVAEKLSPGSLVINRFGSASKVAAAMARVSDDAPPCYRAVLAWRDGLVPSKYQSWLISAAKYAKIKLTHKELIEGGEA